jgi:hypothetical protein
MGRLDMCTKYWWKHLLDDRGGYRIIVELFFQKYAVWLSIVSDSRLWYYDAEPSGSAIISMKLLLKKK